MLKKYTHRFVSIFLTIYIINYIAPLVLWNTKVQAQEIEKTPFVEFERTDLRTETSKTFQTGENSFRYEGETGRIHYGSKGSLQDVNNNVIYSPFDRYTFRNVANNYSFFAGKTALEGVLLSGFGGVCELKLDEIDGVSINEASQAVITGNIVTYRNVYPGADLEFVIGSEGIETNIVAHTQSALKQNIKFDITNCKLQFDKPVVSDKYTEKLVSQTVSQEEDGTKLVLNPDYSNLSLSNGPIRIDPSISKGTLQDLYVSPSTSFGNRAFMLSGRYMDCTVGCPDTLSAKALMQFDMSLPAGSIVTGSSLRIYHYATSSLGGNFDMKVSKLNGSFSEFSTTNGSYPGDDDANWGSATIPGNWSGVAVERAIGLNNSLINSLRSSNTGLVVKPLSNPNARGIAFCAKETDSGLGGGHPCNNAANNPRLVIDYLVNQNPDIPNPTAPTTNSTFSGNCDESVIPATGICRTTTSVTTQAQVNDPDTIFEADMDYSNFIYSGANSFTSSNKTGDNWATISETSNFNDGVTNWIVRSRDRFNATRDSASFTFTTDTTPPNIPNSIPLPQFSAGVGIDDTIQVEPMFNSTTDNVSSPANVYYNLEYSTSSDFSTNVYSSTIWQQADPTFEVGPKGFDSLAGTSDDLLDDNTYFFRVKARDQLNNTSAFSTIISTTIDGTKPVINSFSSDLDRFSPNNSTSVGVKDTVEFNINYIEKYTNNIILNIKDSSDAIVKSITHDLSSQSVDSSARSHSMIWDGTDDSSNFLLDGAYTANVILSDKAGNINNVSSTLIIIVDNNEANITISSPQNYFWTNQNNIDLSGQVTAPNDLGEEDGDIATFELEHIGTSGWENVTFDGTGIFTINKLLNLGNNKFNLKTTDLVSNTKEVEWDVNHETSAPQILNVLPNNLSNDRTPIVSFNISDPDPTSDGLLKSDIPFGTNPWGMEVWLTFNTWNRSSWDSQIKKLIENGVNLDSSLVSDLACSPSSGALTATKNSRTSADNLDCSLNFVSDLEPDTTYTIHIKAKDNAGNEIYKNDVSFQIDSHQFLQIDNPVEGAIYSNSSVLFKGKGAKDSQLTISNDQLAETRTFTLDNALNGTGQDTFLTSDFTVTCGEFIDIDSRADTPDEEVCSFEVYVKQDFASTDSDTLNTNHISLIDLAGNNITISRNITVNIFSFDLFVSSDLNFFSPNGDGRQDAITFSHEATNPTDPINQPQIVSYQLRIINDLGEVVRTFEDNNILPIITLFNGQVETPIGSGNWDWIQDGIYTFELEVVTLDGATKTTSPQNIIAKTNLQDEVIITNPVTGSVTTYGVINVQGQGPKSQLEEGATGNLRGEVKVRICVDTLTIPNSVGCDVESEAVADEFGFFSTLVILPRIDGYTQLEHNISAYAYDNFGNQTQNSNTVLVILDTVDPFNGVSITPTLTGVSDPDLYERFLNGDPSVTIDDLRSIILTSNVTQNTEWVDMAFADYSNLSQRPDTSTYQYIDRLNGICNNPAGCSWDYTYPVPSDFGGIYEVEFTGKKGDTIQTLTAGFMADGSIPAAPILLVVEKYDPIKGNWVKIESISDIHYTKETLLRIRGAAEPNIDLNIFSNNVQIGSAQVSQTGVWEFEIDLDTYLSNLSSPSMNCIENNGTRCNVADFEFKVSIDDPLFSTESVNTKKIRFDEIAPSLTSIDRTTPQNTIKGFANSGDEVSYTLESNEPLNYADLIKEDGFVRLLTNLSTNTKWGGSINIEQEEEGFYNPQIRIIDYAGNRTDYDALNWNSYGLGDFRIYVDNTDPNPTLIDKAQWSTSWDQGGVNADGVYPELGRTNPEYVTKRDRVTISAKAERNQRVEVFVNYALTARINVSDTNCESVDSSIITPDSLTVKYGEVCDWSYDFVFPDNGSNDQFGVPNHYYIFQVRVVDSAYNPSPLSKQEIVFHDNQNPEVPQIYNASSASYNPIVQWHASNVAGGLPATKDTSVTLTSYAERNADMEYSIQKPKIPNPELITLFTNSSDRKYDKEFALGTKGDDRDGCVIMDNGRRRGVCEDGIYAFNLAVTDGAGLKSPTATSQVERDTVAPQKPSLTVSPDTGTQKVYLNISGEPGAQIYINGTSYGNIDGDGQVSVLVISSNNWEYDTKYVWKVHLVDKVGNQGESSYASYTTPPPPVRGAYVCRDTSKSGKLVYPFTGSYPVTSNYGMRKLNGKDNFHSGVDFGTPMRTEILNSAKGTVIYSNKTDRNAGLGVIVHHQELGINTLYWHFDETYLNVDYSKSRPQGMVLGLSGNTGFSTGPHLHFTTRTGGPGTEVDPYNGWLESCENWEKTPDEEKKNSKGIDGATKEKPWGNKTDNDIPWATIEFDRRLNFLRNDKYNEIKKAEIPAPIITFVETLDSGDKVKLYGIATSKGKPMHVDVNNEYRQNLFINSWESKYIKDKAQHVRVSFYKEDWTKLGELWMNEGDGRWSIELSLDGKLGVGDKIMAYQEIYSDFQFDDLRWWSDTKENVKFNLNGNPAGGPSNKMTVPEIWNSDPAIRAIKNLESKMDAPNRIGNIRDWCGTKIQEYNSIRSEHGDKTGSIILYNPEDKNAYFMTGAILWKFKELNGHNCTYPNETGYPKNNESKAAKSKQNTDGWFQNYAHKSKGWSSIYSSYHGHYLVTGDIRNKFEDKGGTNNWNYLGYPKKDANTNDVSTCGVGGQHQDFEGGKIYASKYGKHDFSYGRFLDEYWERGEVKSIGWPKSGTWWDWGVEKADFETGRLAKNMVYEGFDYKGCPHDESRDNDSKNGAPENVINTIWDKEDQIFESFTRADGINGEIHEYCKGWVVDYSNSKLKKDSKEIGYNWIMYNPKTNSAYHLDYDIWEKYWQEGKGCEKMGLPASEKNDIGGMSWGWRNGFGYQQIFDKGDVYYYERPTGLVGEEKYKYIILDPIRGKYDSWDGKNGELKFPVSDTEWKESCGYNGYVQNFTDGGIHKSGIDSQIFIIRGGMFKGYISNGGFDKFGFATNDEYKVYEDYKDGYMQDFIKGFSTNKSKDSITEYSFDEFLGDCNRTQDDSFLEYLGNVDNILSVVRDELIILGGRGSASSMEHMAYNSLYDWHKDSWNSQKVGADFWNSGKVQIDHLTFTEKVVLEQSYIRELRNEIDDQNEALTKMTTRIGIQEFEEGKTMDDYWEKYINYMFIVWEEEEKITAKSNEVNKQKLIDGTVTYKIDYKLTRNRYLIDNVNNELSLQTFFTSIKFLFSAGVSNLDKAGEGFKDGIGECIVDTVKFLWPPEWINAGYQLGEFLMHAPEFFENLDLIIYFGTQSVEGKEYSVDEARAYAFGKGVGAVVCLTVDIWLGKAVTKLSGSTKLKAIASSMKESQVFKQLGEVAKDVRLVNKVDDLIKSIKKINHLPEITRLRIEGWWFIKKGYIDESFKSFKDLNKYEQRVAIYYARKGYKGITPYKEGSGPNAKNLNYHDFDMMTPEGRTFRLESKHIEGAPNKYKIREHVEKGNIQILNTEYKNAGVEDSIITVDLTDVTLTKQEAIEYASKNLRDVTNFKILFIKGDPVEWGNWIFIYNPLNDSVEDQSY